jgi:hypothetical protein
MRKRAYLHSRETIWPKTAQKYMASFQRARFERTLQPKAAHKDDVAMDAIDLLAGIEYRSHVEADRRHRHSAACNFPCPIQAKAIRPTTMRAR